MREDALTVRRIKRFVKTTDSDHDEPVYPNLALDFEPDGPDQLWRSDITYIRIATGWIYLAVILDAWSRKVVGYAISRSIDTQLTLAALRAACDNRHPPAGCIHHSDRGVQYAARAYRDELEARGLLGSMSRRANVYDCERMEVPLDLHLTPITIGFMPLRCPVEPVERRSSCLLAA